MRKMTTQPVAAGDANHAPPEFVRLKDLERLFGIKRGTAYNLLNARKIKGLVLRVRGLKSGVRLIEFQSVCNFVRGQMEMEVVE